MFIPSCGCGRLRKEHSDKAKNSPTSDTTWEASSHTKDDGPTDAFGELEFTGGGPASRAKVSDA